MSPAYLLDRVIELPHDGLVRKVELGDVLVVLGQGLTGDRQLCTIDEVGVLQKILHQRRDTADLV